MITSDDKLSIFEDFRVDRTLPKYRAPIDEEALKSVIQSVLAFQTRQFGRERRGPWDRDNEPMENRSPRVAHIHGR